MVVTGGLSYWRHARRRRRYRMDVLHALQHGYSNSYVIATALGAFIVGFSSIMTGLNFVVTIHTMRAPGLTWFRLPLFIWSHYATSVIILLGTPVLAITIVLLALERVLGLGIFNPALGGDPDPISTSVLVYSHPAVTS